MGILQAECTVCNETFVPNDEDDTIHAEREDGTPCGGLGIITGEWVAPSYANEHNDNWFAEHVEGYQ